VSSKTQEPTTVAAVDLGSNSFHMVIGRFVRGELQIMDRMREQVMLAAGLDDDDHLSEESQARGLACLERIGQRLRSLPSVRVRAVGTNTLRRAKNGREFRARAQTALGFPIEIISGQEEARLIFLGVAHDQFSSDSRLVVDIGGGSTEVILGEGYQALRSHSLFMGCVRYSRRYFPDGVLRKECFHQAEIAAALELRTMQREIRNLGWASCLGSSGTIMAVQEIMRAAGWTDGVITWTGLKKLRRAILACRSLGHLTLPALKSERAPVLPGGVAILRAVFRCLEIDSMTAANGALREGVLHDLLGRMRSDDIRDYTIRRMVERYQADLGQAVRVEQVALRLLKQVDGRWALEPEQIRKLLIWASQLHEIGLALSYTGFHKHGAYLIENSHMPGFSADDQAMLAAIVRGQRRKILPEPFARLAAGTAQTVLRLCVIFRLAVLLNRSRTTQVVPRIEVADDWQRIRLTFPAGWSETHPLTCADLDQEGAYLRALGIETYVEEEAARTRTARD